MKIRTMILAVSALALAQYAPAQAPAKSAAAPPSRNAITPGATEQENINDYVEMIRKDIKREKVSILTGLMQLLPEESAKFWPVYNEFDKELTALSNERIAFIKQYAESFNSLTDAKINQIANGLLDVEGKRNALKKKYYQRMSQALNPKLAARFLQIETQIEQLLDLQISASLPIVQ